MGAEISLTATCDGPTDAFYFGRGIPCTAQEQSAASINVKIVWTLDPDTQQDILRLELPPEWGICQFGHIRCPACAP